MARLFFGRKVIGTRFLVDGRVALGWRALALMVLALPPIVLGLYALRRWRALLAAVVRAFAELAGRVFIAGVLIFGLTELFEKPLGRIPGLPRFMVEETFELLAGVCFAIALHAHWRLRKARHATRRNRVCHRKALRRVPSALAPEVRRAHVVIVQ